MDITDMTETNLIALRRAIYLTVKSSLNHEEAAHKLLKMTIKPGQEVVLLSVCLSPDSLRVKFAI